jgi:peptidoglycan hydrolase CwlO-like protein
MRFFRLKTFFLFLFFFLSFGALSALAVTEQECNQKTDLSEKIACLESLLGQTTSQKITLSSEISKLNTSVVLTTANITKTLNEITKIEEEIIGLETKIGLLDRSLDEISALLVNRISVTYKKGKADSLELFLSSKSFSDFVSRYKYLKVTQIHDRKLLLQMETARANYDAQKTLKEEKQVELEKAKAKLESQRNLLASQKRDKEYLLQVTQNDEKRFQDILSRAKAELVAIKGILAGSGTEMEVGQVSEGQKIASMKYGASCNSSNTHLHFMVTSGNETYNPFQFLRSGISFENCSGSSCGAADGDPFNPSGSWNWPLNEPIKLTQGYGNTWAVSHTWVRNIYSFHNGIDLFSNSLDVKAVANGTLYHGIYKGSCNLFYVRVKHSDSDKDTYYLHVDY